MRVIAISGNTGTGKTTLLNILGGRGHGTINSDRITHTLLQECGSVQDIRRRFFTDHDFRVAHEKWIMPKIYKAIIKEAICLFLKGHGIVFIEVPLLFELKLNPYFYTVVVACDRDLQMKRARSVEYLSERLALQLPIEEKIKLAQLVIYNNGDVRDLVDVVDGLDFRGCSIYSCLLTLLAAIMLAIVPE